MKEGTLTTCLRTLQDKIDSVSSVPENDDHAPVAIPAQPPLSALVPDVSLSDEHTGVVHRLGQTKLEHLSLQAALKEILNLETQNVIELHAVLVQNTQANQAAKKCVTLEKAQRVLTA